MKELSIEEKAKAYDKAVEKVKSKIKNDKDHVFYEDDIIELFPQLAKSEDERIRKRILFSLQKDIMATKNSGCNTKDLEKCIAWLEKQKTNEIINRDEFAQGVLRGAAINLITWIDYNSAEGNMCLSNMECKDIENALVHADWGRIYAYLKKKLENEQD